MKFGTIFKKQHSIRHLRTVTVSISGVCQGSDEGFSLAEAEAQTEVATSAKPTWDSQSQYTV